VTADRPDRIRRWPVHPVPEPGEALTSWLTRIADRYDMSVSLLLRHNLGAASMLVEAAVAADLDFDPPLALLQAISERTGNAVADLRLMTIAGWVPWLADCLDPADGQQMFDNYVRSDSALLLPAEAGTNVVTRWRPWLSTHDKGWRTAQRLCPACARQPERGTALFTAVPVMLSCIEHGCLLEPAAPVRVGLALKEPVAARPATDAVIALDTLTWTALTTGEVLLPGRPERPVHAGLWLRMLRMLLDEVSISTSRLGIRSTAIVERIWNTTGQPIRAGLAVWKPYERLDTARQQAMLEAVATAVHLAEAGAITPGSTLGELLTRPRHRSVYDGDVHWWSTPGPTDPWSQFWQDAENVVTAARSDPGTARWLLELFTRRCKTLTHFNLERAFLMNNGIPAAYLPGAYELGRSDLLRDDQA